MLKLIPVKIDNLLLDPNNPRFVCDLSAQVVCEDRQLEKQQENTLKRFERVPRKLGPDEDATNIKMLYESMVRIGYSGIDRVVVRSIIGSSSKYLVLEGNRRIASAKSILRDYHGVRPPLDDVNEASRTNRERVASKLGTFETIECLLLDTTNLTGAEVVERVAKIVGIRHHGSLLEWDVLPKAFNIFSEYMRGDSTQTSFVYAMDRAKSIAQQLCISLAVVDKALRTYQAYLQARTRFPEVKDEHFSLIEAGVHNKLLLNSYFTVDRLTFLLNEESLTKLGEVCQFATRDSRDSALTTDSKKKICPDPKAFGKIATLWHRMAIASHPAIKAYGTELIKRVENEDDLEATVDVALDSLTEFENRTLWAESIHKLLMLQEEKLAPGDYAGNGLERARLDGLIETFSRLRKIIGD